MLAITFKSDIVLSKNSLEEIWANYLTVTFPHFVDELGPCLNDSTLSAERVLV